MACLNKHLQSLCLINIMSLTHYQMKFWNYLVVTIWFFSENCHPQLKFDYHDSRCMELQSLLPLTKSNWAEDHITQFDIPYFDLYHKIKQLNLEKCSKTIQGERKICKINGFKNFLKYLDPLNPRAWSIQVVNVMMIGTHSALCIIGVATPPFTKFMAFKSISRQLREM